MHFLEFMPLIDELMPAYRMREVVRTHVAAPPDRAWKAARGMDLSALGLVRALFSLRTIPERFRRWRQGGPRVPFPRHSFIDDLGAPGSGFSLVGEAEREVVVGSIGKFWKSEIEWAHVPVSGFARSLPAGYGKLAWSLRVDPDLRGGSWISLDLRVTASDDATWRSFQRYWRLIGPFSLLIRRLVGRQLRRELGAAPRPRALALPGDELLPGRLPARTHTRLIEASPARVWPWLAQMGARRAGWYSIDRLDNEGQRSAERIIPGLQQLQVGQRIASLPRGEEAFAVLRVEPERALVLGSPSLLPQGGPELAPFRMTWAFVLEPVGPGATRLLVRVRGKRLGGIRHGVQMAIAVALHEVMERAQLRHLKSRAELPA